MSPHLDYPADPYEAALAAEHPTLPLDHIVHQGPAGQLFTTSTAIAEGAGTQHKNVLEMIDRHRPDFERFGTVAFETRPLPGGGKAQRVALLNEHQATLLLTYARNTDQVRRFKSDLVDAFYQLAQRHTPAAMSLEEMTLQVMTGPQARVDAQAQELATARPKAESFDSFLSAHGDYDARDAAQILSRDHGIDIGQKRVFQWLRAHRWIGENNRPYQDHVDAGRLRLKAGTFRFQRTNGEEQLARPQVRITPKGVHDMATIMRREAPAALTSH